MVIVENLIAKSVFSGQAVGVNGGKKANSFTACQVFIMYALHISPILRATPHWLGYVCAELCVSALSLSWGFISICCCVEPQPISIGSPPGFHSLNLILM